MMNPAFGAGYHMLLLLSIGAICMALVLLIDMNIGCCDEIVEYISKFYRNIRAKSRPENATTQEGRESSFDHRPLPSTSVFK